LVSFCRFAIGPAVGIRPAGRLASFCRFALDPADDRGLAARVASFCRIAIGRGRVGAGRAGRSRVRIGRTGRTRGGIGRAGRVGSRVGRLGDVRVLRRIADRPLQPGEPKGVRRAKGGQSLDCPPKPGPVLMGIVQLAWIKGVRSRFAFRLLTPFRP
jgi:hypothetical protein